MTNSRSTDVPALTLLDPRRLRPLRSTVHAELKNDIMMALLTHMEWFVEYRKRLEAYRTRSAPRPTYPSDAVDRVETLVDQLIKDALDPEYRR